MSISSEMAADGAQSRPAEPGPNRLTSMIQNFSLARWIGPAVVVRLLGVDAVQSGWLVDTSGRLVPAKASDSAAFSALQVPDALLLWKTVVLPPLSSDALRTALALQARALSPFPESDTVWSFSSRLSQSGAVCELALASRQQLDAWRQSAAPDAAAAGAAELWAVSEHGNLPPVVLPGFGEKRRESALRLRQWGLWALFASLVVLCAAALLSPTLQLYLRAQQAQAAHLQVREQARSAMTSREAFQRTSERWAALREQVGGALDAVRLLEVLTRLLPDDAFLSRLQVEGHKVTLTGQAANAAALMERLGAEPGLGAVRAPSPATKVANAAQERFVIELQVDPKVFATGAASESPASATPLEARKERP